DQRQDEALQLSLRARAQVEGALREQHAAGVNQGDTLKAVVKELAAGQADAGLSILLVTSSGSYPSDPKLTTGVLPTRLVDAVTRESRVAYVYVDSPIPTSRRMLVVGSPIPSQDFGTYQGYFFFPLTFQEKTLALLVRILGTVGLVLLATTIVLAAISTGRVLEPIRRARDVAEQITGGNLSARIPQANTHDDFGRLADSFNRMAAFLAQKINELEHLSSLQARFVPDVSHELRTPLATVRMAADYIHSARSGLPTDAQRAAVLLERELARLHNRPEA